MGLCRLPAEEAAVRRFVAGLWLPYHRDLESAVERHALADGVDIVSEEVAFRLDRLGSEGYRTWVAVDGVPAPTPATLADGDGELAGFVTTELDGAPSVFDRPDRLVVGDLYVREAYRGSSLARALLERCAERAREAGCPELVLDVDADNERAVAFYEKLGFETYRRRMALAADEL